MKIKINININLIKIIFKSKISINYLESLKKIEQIKMSDSKVKTFIEEIKKEMKGFKLTYEKKKRINRETIRNRWREW